MILLVTVFLWVHPTSCITNLNVEDFQFISNAMDHLENVKSYYFLENSLQNPSEQTLYGYVGTKLSRPFQFVKGSDLDFNQLLTQQNIGVILSGIDDMILQIAEGNENVIACLDLRSPE